MYWLLGMAVGALVPTFLVSRLFLWAAKRWKGTGAVIIANALSGAVCCIISALGHADGGPLNWSYSWVYLLAQVVWLAIDLWRARQPNVEAAN